MNLNATLIIEVLSFLILLGLLVKLLYRPVLGILDKRAHQIQEANEKIQESLASAAKERSEAEHLLSESKNQALQMREQAREDAELLRQKIVNQAKEETERFLRAGRQEILNQTQKAKEKLKAETIDLSLAAAEKILRRHINPGDQKRLIEELTKGIDDGRGASGR